MTRGDFLEVLSKHNIDKRIVVFDDPIRDGYCVKHNYYRWEVFFREKGKEYNTLGFPSESDALFYLSKKLIKVYK